MGLFVCLVVSWMGFVVLAMARTVSQVTGLPLGLITATVGVVGTVYTMAGGLRAVIWKEVLQVVLMIGGCLVTLGYVAWATGGTWLPQWVVFLIFPYTFLAMAVRFLAQMVTTATKTAVAAEGGPT